MRIRLDDRVGLSQSSVSRNLKRLGVRLRQDVKGAWVDAGMGLVDTRPDLYETRKLASTLTKKGVKLMHDLQGALK
jgi:DNA-binding MarR family transcriptional regulator